MGYHNRGMAYRGKGDFGRAVEGMTEAIRIRPNDAAALVDLGLTYLMMGKYDASISSFDKLIGIDPKSFWGFFARGRVNFYKRDFSAAAKDLAKSAELSPTDLYPLLWLHLAKKGLHLDDKTELAQRAAKIDSGKWPEPVVKYYLGEMTARQLFNAAVSHDEVTERGQFCEMKFYAAEDKALGWFPLWAKARFKAAAAACPTDFIEYEGAVAELRRRAAVPNEQ
jgi:lipoprotein NlpI